MALITNRERNGCVHPQWCSFAYMECSNRVHWYPRAAEQVRRRCTSMTNSKQEREDLRLIDLRCHTYSRSEWKKKQAELFHHVALINSEIVLDRWKRFLHLPLTRNRGILCEDLIDFTSFGNILTVLPVKSFMPCSTTFIPTLKRGLLEKYSMPGMPAFAGICSGAGAPE